MHINIAHRIYCVWQGVSERNIVIINACIESKFKWWLLRSFNGGKNLVGWNLDNKKVKEREKEADIPSFPQKTNKALDTGLCFTSHRHRAPPLARVFASLSRKVAQRRLLCSKELV